MAAIVDTNILVYVFDPRDALKQEIATSLVRQGIADQSVTLPYQALVEFVAVTTRAVSGRSAILTKERAHREVENFMDQLPVIYPTQQTLQIALRGAALYQMPWFDALIWAYADENGLDRLWSEDFQNGRRYGGVRVENPFRGSSIHEPRASYGSPG